MGFEYQVRIGVQPHCGLRALAERCAMPGMHPDRAELLPVGGAILLEAMQFLEIEEILVSDHGLRYGILHETLAEN